MTARVIDKRLNGRVLHTVVRFVDDAGRAWDQEILATTLSGWQQQVRAIIADAAAATTAEIDIPLGLVRLPDPPPPPPEPPPPPPPPRELFDGDVRILMRMDLAIRVGVKPATDLDYQTLKTKLGADLVANPAWFEEFDAYLHG